jgi:hypothetical protein
MLRDTYQHAEFVRKLVDQAPPLSEGQRAQLGVLLAPMRESLAAERGVPLQRAEAAA